MQLSKVKLYDFPYNYALSKFESDARLFLSNICSFFETFFERYFEYYNLVNRKLNEQLKEEINYDKIIVNCV